MNLKAIIAVIIVLLIIAVGAFAYISANTHNTRVDVISNSSLKNGDAVQIVLKDDYRNVYPGETVEVKILDDSGWGDTYPVVTDSEGEGSVILSGYENGNYTININYNGTLFNKQFHSVYNLVIDDGYSSYY
ncbi:hypothetical protein [Methanobrevibacter sp.]